MGVKYPPLKNLLCKILAQTAEVFFVQVIYFFMWMVTIFLLLKTQSRIVKNVITKNTKPKHGGSRLGSGRPKGEPTTTISFRVKVKHKDIIVKVVTAEIKRLATTKYKL